MTDPEMLALYTFLAGWWLFTLLVFSWPTVAARIVRSVPLWLAYSLLALALDIIGLVLIGVLAGFRLWYCRASTQYGSPKDGGAGKRQVTAWRGGLLTWLWGNEEDGVVGPEWWRDRTMRPLRDRIGAPWYRWAWCAYRWSALRNPSNNLRFIPGINPVIRPDRVRSWEWDSRTMPSSYNRPKVLTAILAWQGVYSGIRLHIAFRGGLYRFWWGWKLKPEDAQGVPADDMRKPRCGFGTQLKRIG